MNQALFVYLIFIYLSAFFFAVSFNISINSSLLVVQVSRSIICSVADSLSRR